MKTFETGKSLFRIPATLKRYNPYKPNDPEEFNLLISTDKLADMVLLRIDKMEAEKTA